MYKPEHTCESSFLALQLVSSSELELFLSHSQLRPKWSLWQSQTPHFKSPKPEQFAENCEKKGLSGYSQGHVHVTSTSMERVSSTAAGLRVIVLALGALGLQSRALMVAVKLTISPTWMLVQPFSVGWGHVEDIFTSISSEELVAIVTVLTIF